MDETTTKQNKISVQLLHTKKSHKEIKFKEKYIIYKYIWKKINQF